MLCAALLSGCGILSWGCPKPKPCPECPAARTITVHEGCWEKVPDLGIEPEDLQDSITQEEILKLATAFVILANYVEEQRARCGKKPAEGETDVE
jgi:hypothetical protein